MSRHQEEPPLSRDRRRMNRGREDTIIGPCDAELVESFLRGEEKAFECLVLRYQARLRAVLCRLAGDVGDAEDMAQETFIRVYKGLRGFRGEASFKTWLFRIAARLATDLDRKRKRRPARVGLEQGNGAMVHKTAQKTPPQDLIMKEVTRHLECALEKLPFQQRAALVLKAVEGMKYKEIAKALDSTEGSIKSGIHLARKRLVELVGEEDTGQRRRISSSHGPDEQ